MITLTTPIYNYSSILKDAAKSRWRVEDLIGVDKPLDFSKAFLPEEIAHTQIISCLTQNERLKLNHIRANSYLHLFGVVEEFILPLVLGHVQSIGCDNIEATQAYLGFAQEESKHIHLFRQFSAAFEAGFGFHCSVIGPAKAIADFVFQYSPLGVALVTLHIEWMTQHHFLDSVRNHHGEPLDSRFCSLLKHHWQEEAQHARLDTLMVRDLAQTLDSPAIEDAIDDYLAIIEYLNNGLKAQVQFDIIALEQAIGRSLTASDREEIRKIQELSYKKTFLDSGITHPNFMQSVRDLSAAGYARILAIANTFS